jgi:hypothetical protein
MCKIRWTVLLVCFYMLLSTTAYAEPAERKDKIVTGPGVGLDVSAGLIGVFAAVNLGLVFPKISENLQLGLLGSWSMPAVSVAHENAAETAVVTYLPWMAYGAVFLHVGTPVIRDLFKVYFGLEVLAGTTKAVQDDYIGKNVTVGAIPYLGMEFYVKQSLAIFLETGVSAVFTLTSDDSTELGTMSQHGGTGYFLRIGPRFYFGKH